MFLIGTSAQGNTLNSCQRNCIECHTLSQEDANRIFKDLGEVKDISMSPVKGLWLIRLEKDGQPGTAYLDFARKNIIAGDIFSLQGVKPSVEVVDHPQPGKAKIDIASMPLKNSIKIGNPEGKKKLFVFSDPDCPFCRRLHRELLKLEEIAPDVAIYIIPYPLPMHPGAYDKARVLLEKGSRELVDRAFEGGALPEPTRPDSRARIDANVSFAKANGILAAPTCVFTDGSVIEGMQEAETLKRMLATGDKP
jgi:thiol:disulfide interchange protein DsbC